MPTYTLFFSGAVQGVGFRATCQHLARRLPGLGGRVCNLPDGRVQLTVRGRAEDVTKLVAALREVFPGYIEDVEQRELAPADDPLPVGLSGVHITRGP
jgi:acylphosphatase